MPILAAAALSAGIDPILLMIPAAMSASCAFMLPVATAPNAVVYGTDRIPIQTMFKFKALHAAIKRAMEERDVNWPPVIGISLRRRV